MRHGKNRLTLSHQDHHPASVGAQPTGCPVSAHQLSSLPTCQRLRAGESGKCQPPPVVESGTIV